MNREDIIRMARKAGIDWSGNSTKDVLVRAMQVAYAAGVAAERKEFAAHAVDIARRAVAAEREECAKTAEQYQDPFCGQAVADEIRARGQQ